MNLIEKELRDKIIQLELNLEVTKYQLEDMTKKYRRVKRQAENALYALNYGKNKR